MTLLQFVVVCGWWLVVGAWCLVLGAAGGRGAVLVVVIVVVLVLVDAVSGLLLINRCIIVSIVIYLRWFYFPILIIRSFGFLLHQSYTHRLNCAALMPCGSTLEHPNQPWQQRLPND